MTPTHPVLVAVLSCPGMFGHTAKVLPLSTDVHVPVRGAQSKRLPTTQMCDCVPLQIHHCRKQSVALAPSPDAALHVSGLWPRKSELDESVALESVGGVLTLSAGLAEDSVMSSLPAAPPSSLQTSSQAASSGVLPLTLKLPSSPTSK